jgi:hypothetical protein
VPQEAKPRPYAASPWSGRSRSGSAGGRIKNQRQKQGWSTGLLSPLLSAGAGQEALLICSAAAIYAISPFRPHVAVGGSVAATREYSHRQWGARIVCLAPTQPVLPGIGFFWRARPRRGPTPRAAGHGRIGDDSAIAAFMALLHS